MANRRMFSLSVIDTDLFLDMPVTARLLYYELGMRADDDGFVGNWKKIMRVAGLSEDDMKILIAKKFVIIFDSGIIVIRHWRLNNYIRSDRHTPTRYKAELEQLFVEEEVYNLESIENSTMLPNGIPEGGQLGYPGKDRIGKDRIGKVNNKGAKKFAPPTLEEIQDYITEKQLDVDAKQFYDYFDTGNWIDSKGNKVKNWKQKLLTWNKYNKGSSNRLYEPQKDVWVEFMKGEDDDKDRVYGTDQETM